MFDIVIAAKEKSPGRPILTVTDEEAADKIISAIEDQRDKLFQVEGLIIFKREVARGVMPTEIPHGFVEEDFTFSEGEMDDDDGDPIDGDAVELARE